MENKQIIDGIIVVEGKSDVAFLSSFIDATFITTNGSEISENTINLIKKYQNEGYKIIVLTDPDGQGKRIREIINNNVEGCYNCFLKKENCIKNNKVGVAEGDKNEIIKNLTELKVFSNKKVGNLTLKDLIYLGFAGENCQNKRNFISNYFGFDYCNNKNFLKRLNQLNINKEDIIKALEEYK